MRKTWSIFLATRVEFYRLSCASASQLPAPTKKMAEGGICLTAHQTEASCFCCRRCCFMVPVGIPTIPLFPISSFLFFFPHPPSTLTPSGIRVLLTQSLIFTKTYFKKVALSFPPPPGLRVRLSVTDPERSCLILHKIQTEEFF